MVGESRTELVNWLNETLQLDYKKVEQCGNGAVYCQLLDSIYQDIPMSRVNFDAKSEFDISTNMKILQAGFHRHGITKIIDVDRIMKCRLQDNLELLQWFKKHWMEKKDFNVEYDPVSRRRRGPAGAATGQGQPRRPSSAGVTAAGAGSAARPIGSRVSTRTPSGTGAKVGTRVLSGSKSPVNVSKATTPTSRTPSGSIPNGATGNAGSAATAAANAKIAQLTKELAEANSQVSTLTGELTQVSMDHDALQAERNFFYQKLVDIEVLVDTTKESITDSEDPVYKLADQVSEILVATEEGFSSVQQDDMDLEASADKFNIEAESF